MGPLRRTKVEDCRSRTCVPVTSEGSRSGVNWTLSKCSPKAFEKARQSVVFAVPGTPSNSTCPDARSAISIWSITWFWPTMILPRDSCNSPRRPLTKSGRLPVGVEVTVLQFFKLKSGMGHPSSQEVRNAAIGSGYRFLKCGVPSSTSCFLHQRGLELISIRFSQSR